MAISRMKQRWLLNLALALLIAALASFIYFKPKPPKQTEFNISTLAANQATSILIEKPGQPPLKLEKRGAGWFLAAPFQARADQVRVAKALEILGAKSSERFPATDRARFELDRPLLRITINAQEFSFGAQHPFSGQIYLASEGYVYLVAPRHFIAAAANAYDFASKQLFDAAEIPDGFDFLDFRLAQQNGKWTRTPAAESSQDQINQWSDEWRHAISLTAQPYFQGKAIAAFSVHLANGKTIPFKILQREPELILLRTDENMQFHFPQDIGARLLNPK